MRLRFRWEAETTVLGPEEAEFLVKRALKGRDYRLVAGAGVPLHGLAGLDKAEVFRIPKGEKAKSWKNLQELLLWLKKTKADRHTVLLAYGGGAVLDLAAMAAGLYQRGIPLVLVPSTLLAMVDASVGGKAAVNAPTTHAGWKNFAGLFYPAERVLLMPEMLLSLPRAERISGASECAKALWLGGFRGSLQALMDYCKGYPPTERFWGLVRKSIRIKMGIVKKDPLDRKGIRVALNLGHTVGHALESQEEIPHGIAVLWGIAVESSLGRSPSFLKAGSTKILRDFGLEVPSSLRKPKKSQWISALLGDKKRKAGKISIPLLGPQGRVQVKSFSPEAVFKAVKAFHRSYQSEENNQ
jgi:3-dehydroquinate synthetase